MKSFYSLFRGITRSVLSYLSPVPRASAQPIAYPRLRPLHADLSGVNKISPLRGERFVHNSRKYGAFPKSHAALRFLPLRNCVVSSVKKRELSEATRNGM